jgi:hypothetical protein
MITPAYSLTATERVLPRLALDFTTALLDARVTVTRALNTATRINSSGYIEVVNADLPRFDYDPVTVGTCKGLLIEEARTNILLYSNNFRDTATAGSSRPWVYDGATITADATTSPDGTQNASKLVENNASSAHAVRQTVTTVATTTYAPSIYVKGDGSGRNTRVFAYQSTSPFTAVGFATVNLANGAVLAGAGTVTPAGDGWYRVSFSGAAPSTGTVFRVDVANGTSTNYQGDGTSGVYIYGGQLEAGAFATSYIPTTTTSLTRNADAVGMTGTNFSDWFNATEGAFEAEYSSYVATNSSNSKGILAATDGTTGNRLYLNINTAGIPFFFVSASSSTQVNISTGVTLVNGAVTRTTAAYKLNSFAAATNGTLGTPDTVGTVPTVNRLDIGSLLTSPQLNGHFRKLMYWPQRITNSETQAFSK